MLQDTIDKTALAHQVQAQLHQFVMTQLGPLLPQLNAQSYRNLVDLTEGLVRIEVGISALWTSEMARNRLKTPATPLREPFFSVEPGGEARGESW